MSGENALENIPHELNVLGVKKPIILTDAILAKTGALNKLVKLLSILLPNQEKRSNKLLLF